MIKKMDSKHKRVAMKAWQPCSKQKLKELCMQRVKRERDQLLWKIRSTKEVSTTPKEVVVSALGEIVNDEISKLSQQSHKQDDAPSEQDADEMLWEYEPTVDFSEFAEEDYEELMIAMERILHEDIQTELLQRDTVQLLEYENACEMEEKSLAVLLEHSEKEQENGLLCPICKISYLQQNQHLIYCSCGQFRLDTEDHQVDMEFLRVRLAELLQQHYESSCQGQPSFCLNSRFSITALYMQCSLCEVFDLVL